MKKISLFLALIILAILSVTFLAWANKENILAHFLSRELHVPTSLRLLEIDKQGATLDHFWVGNPPHSQTSTSFAAETTRIDTSLDALFGNPLVIEKIEIDNIFVGIEFYDKQGTKTNWNVILPDEKEETKSSRDYLIKTLILHNLTVEVTKVDGTVKRYPTISEMEFHNITSETGFPIDEIEKAIFNLMMKNLFQSLPINQLFKASPIPLPLPLP